MLTVFYLGGECSLDALNSLNALDVHWIPKWATVFHTASDHAFVNCQHGGFTSIIENTKCPSRHSPSALKHNVDVRNP